MNYTFDALVKEEGFICPTCHKRHFGGLKECFVGENGIEHLVPLLHKYGVKRPYVLCDYNTFAAAGERVVALLDECGISFALHVVDRDRPAPDEKLVGEAFMHRPFDCDGLVVCGSGVLNDVGKILSSATGKPYILMATAPSMDGFASASSSMERDNFKISLPSRCPDAVIGDLDVLKKAPPHMIASGIGDMLAKYVSLAEWRMGALLLDEPYCETVAEIVSLALKKCVDNGPAAVRGEVAGIKALTEGLIVSGLAMNFVGLSRPASGMEHYISHIMDMRALAFGMPSDLHGIQCGIGTLLTVKAYEKLLTIKPDGDKARAHAASFDREDHEKTLQQTLGKAARSMIEAEAREQKYNAEKHGRRLTRILENWDGIKDIIASLPFSRDLESFMEKIGHPTSYRAIGMTEEQVTNAFCLAADVRDKYVLGRLLWDLGLDRKAFFKNL